MLSTRPAAISCFVIIALLMQCCRSGSQATATTNVQSLTAEEIAAQKLGSAGKAVLSSDGAYALFTEQQSMDHARQSLQFLVIKLDDRSIVYEGSFRAGYVRWTSATEIEVVSDAFPNESRATRKVIDIRSNLK